MNPASGCIEAMLQAAALDYCRYLIRFDSGYYSENEIRAFRDVRDRLLAAALEVRTSA